MTKYEYENTTIEDLLIAKVRSVKKHVQGKIVAFSRRGRNVDARVLIWKDKYWINKDMECLLLGVQLFPKKREMYDSILCIDRYMPNMFDAISFANKWIHDVDINFFEIYKNLTEGKDE